MDTWLKTGLVVTVMAAGGGGGGGGGAGGGPITALSEPPPQDDRNIITVMPITVRIVLSRCRIDRPVSLTW